LDLEKAEYHLKIAVNQNLLEALISYANFLKVYKKDFERGNSFYLKAKELDVNNLYSEVIDYLIKSEKANY